MLDAMPTLVVGMAFVYKAMNGEPENGDWLRQERSTESVIDVTDGACPLFRADHLW